MLSLKRSLVLLLMLVVLLTSNLGAAQESASNLKATHNVATVPIPVRPIPLNEMPKVATKVTDIGNGWYTFCVSGSMFMYHSVSNDTVLVYMPEGSANCK